MLVAAGKDGHAARGWGMAGQCRPVLNYFVVTPALTCVLISVR